MTIPRTLQRAMVIGGLALTLTATTTTNAHAFPGRDSIQFTYTHESITRSAVATFADIVFDGRSGARKPALGQIAVANAAVDDDQYHSALHFDGEAFPEGQARLQDLRIRIALDMSRKDVTAARTHLGQALHTVQDFYAHSNWVELGNSGAYPHLGELGYTIERRASGARCSGSTLTTTELTSGYFSGEDRAPVDGGCRHGGQKDYGSTREGISKDDGYFFNSPHASYHKAAGEAATRGTIAFLNSLWLNELSTTQMAQVLGCL